MGDKRDLIAEFFVGLDEALAQYAARQGIGGPARKAAQSAKDGLKRYSKHLNTGAQFLSAAAIIFPQLKVLAEMLDKAALGLDGALTPKSLHEQKAEIENALRELPEPIIVFIDDTERLDPPEVMEILRLLRAVGDLPNIIYAVCYDRRALVRSIGLALKAANEEEAGEAYLEKIVQATVTIPIPEDFALRRWFLRDVLSLCEPPTDEIINRLKHVIDTEGGKLLETPRDVVRALNSLKLVWPVVRDFVDLPDLVWLHLAKLKRPELYAWIEKYLNGFAEVARGTASASDGEQQAVELLNIVDSYYHPETLDFYRLQEIIPGLTQESRSSGARVWTAFDIDSEKINSLTKARRLGSPHYYRYYFALGQNSGFLPADTIELARMEILNCSDEFCQRLENASEQRFSDGELHFSVLLDSLRSAVSELDEKQAEFLFVALSNHSDLAIQNTPNPFYEGGRSVVITIALMKDIISQKSTRPKWMLDFIQTGKSLSLAAFMVRDVTGNGRFELNWAQDAATQLARLFSERVARLGVEIFDYPNPDFILRVALQNAEEGSDARITLRSLFDLDDNLIRLVGSESARGISMSSKGKTRRPLKLSVFAKILNDEEIPTRIMKIVMNRSKYAAELQNKIDSIVAGLADADATPWRNLYPPPA